ncbi:unnamed protein product, partial [Prorocentrum cordatum]
NSISFDGFHIVYQVAGEKRPTICNDYNDTALHSVPIDVDGHAKSEYEIAGTRAEETAATLVVTEVNEVISIDLNALLLKIGIDGELNVNVKPSVN